MDFKELNSSIDTYKNNSYEKFKSYDRFKFLLKHILPRLKVSRLFLDIGCAKGEFIYMLKEYLPNIQYCGLEYSEELIRLARKERFLDDVEFVQADARDFNLHKEFDVVLMSGALSIFDDYQKPLKCMVDHIRSGGFGYIFGMFNSFDIDVIVKYRNNVKGTKDWESGLNNFSIKGVEDSLNPFCESIKIYDFNLSLDLAIQNDPIKSYTLNTKERGRIIINGTGMVTDFYLIEFEKRRKPLLR